MIFDVPSDGPDAPKIEFPCLYPIKIIGFADVAFKDTVIEVVERHTGKIDAELINARPSKNNNYVSVTVTIAATGKEQLQQIFDDLKKVKSVKMVL
ncbi:MAG: DUF493 domain-containing protein [Gammaproteobacteria bacterium]